MAQGQRAKRFSGVPDTGSARRGGAFLTLAALIIEGGKSPHITTTCGHLVGHVAASYIHLGYLTLMKHACSFRPGDTSRV